MIFRSTNSMYVSCNVSTTVAKSANAKMLSVLLAILISAVANGQNKDILFNKGNVSSAEKSYRNIGKNNFAVHISGNMKDTRDGAIALLLSSGYEKNFGSPEKNGCFFSGELRAKTGKLIDIITPVPQKDYPTYSGLLAGASIAARAYMEISDGIFLYVEGEYGAMYEYIKARYEISGIEFNKSDAFVVPQTGLKFGLRSGHLSFYLGYLYFNHTKAVNQLIPKDFKIVDSVEGIGVELGFGFYF